MEHLRKIMQPRWHALLLASTFLDLLPSIYKCVSLTAVLTLFENFLVGASFLNATLQHIKNF